MNFLRVVLLTLFSLTLLPAQAIEVRTEHHKKNLVTDRPYYTALAAGLANSIKRYTPVAECQVSLENSSDSKIEDRLIITIEMDKQRLYEHIKTAHNLKVVTTREAERYLDNFKRGIKLAAKEIFTEIDQSAVEIRITLSQ